MSSNILVVDDESIGRSVIQGLLGADGYDLQFASDGPSALEIASRSPPDLVLLDIMMPGMDGFEVTKRIRATPGLAEIPVLLVTALDDRSSRLAGLEAGADDFITKPFDRAEMRARIRSILRLNRFRRLHVERANYRHLFEHAPCGLIVMDETTKVLQANTVARSLLDQWALPALALRITDLLEASDQERLLRLLADASKSSLKSPGAEFRVKTKLPTWMDVTVCTTGNGGNGDFLIALVDRTAERLLEHEFHQAQKMECVGRLAGGVAHDFNNLLTVINGFSSIAMEKLPAGGPLHEMITQIYEAGERAASLTRQLLAFSHKEMVAPVEIDLNAVVDGLQKMLRRLIGEHIQLEILLAPEPVRITADPGHIEQVLINLAVNSRDAMPNGGNLVIETERISPKAEGEPSLCRLSISDTGCGMSEAVREHIFEPFFTTKEVGKGTGLGLATVDGIVRRTGGKIRVESEVGKGTRIEIDFPCSASVDQAAPMKVESKAILTGTETILLAEDETSVREFATAVLQAAGYVVLPAVDGEDGLRAGLAWSGPLHLLLTDAVMPKMGGRELADRLTKSRPQVRLLYTSGYDDDVSLLHSVREGRESFLQKPYDVTKLLTKVREVLDR